MIVSIEYIFKTLEYVGLLNLGRFAMKSRRNLQRLFVIFQRILWFIYIFSHSLNTLTRATRYFPEFCQMLFEDLVLLEVLIITLHLARERQELNSLIDFERHIFSQADAEILRESRRLGNLIFFVVLTWIAAATTGANAEAIVLIKEEAELNLRSYIYSTAHPERKHPTTLRIPFIDVSLSPAYEIMFVYIIYVDTVLIFATNAIMTLLPVAVIHLRAQYESLCKFLRMIGEEHRDDKGNRIFYTDFKKNKFRTILSEVKRDGNTSTGSPLENRILLQRYEQFYLKQIIQFHHQLLQFQQKVCGSFYRYLVPKLRVNFVSG